MRVTPLPRWASAFAVLLAIVLTAHTLYWFFRYGFPLTVAQLWGIVWPILTTLAAAFGRSVLPTSLHVIEGFPLVANYADILKQAELSFVEIGIAASAGFATIRTTSSAARAAASAARPASTPRGFVIRVGIIESRNPRLTLSSIFPPSTSEKIRSPKTLYKAEGGEVLCTPCFRF